MKVTKAGSKSGTSKLWICIPDVHFPEHDEQALELALCVVRLLRPDHTLFLGDVLDCAPYSSHPRNSVAEEIGVDWLRSEVEPANEMFDTAQKYTKSTTHYILGNHEHRLERTMAKLGGLGNAISSILDIRKQIGRGRKDFKITPYGVEPSRMRVKLAPKLWAVHGFSTAKRAAAAHLDAARNNSIIYGHCHRSEELILRDPWTGDILSAACPGTISTLSPSYIPSGNPTAWTHGIRLVFVGASGRHNGYNVTFNRNSCVLPDGREITI